MSITRTLAGEFESFADWAQLIDHVRAGYRLWYHAPMDIAPVRVGAVVRARDAKLRVTPIYSNADPFTADTDHLSRFRRLASRLERAE